MEQFAFDEISFDGTIRCRAFPFELRRETCTRPVGVCVRFEITDMRDRLRFIHATITGQREVPPIAITLDPVKRGLPALFIQRHPSEGQPEFRAAVTVAFDKGNVLAIRHWPRRE